MLRAQGMLPISPFRVLQLDSSAPRALIVEAYFALVRRATRRLTGPDDELMRRLHTAYAAAIASHDAAGSGASALDPADHYAVLRVDPCADIEIIEMAYNLLQRIEPVPAGSRARLAREEARRVLSNPALRARYDNDRLNATLTGSPRPALLQPIDAGSRRRKDQPLMKKPARGLFGRRRAPAPDPRDARLLGLRSSLPVAPEDPAPPEVEPEAVEGEIMAQIVFTAGPRAGDHVEVNGNVAPLGDGRSAASVWRHGERFLLRHNGKHVRISGAVPTMPIVVLDDGDEIAVGDVRARFELLASGPPSRSAP